MSRPSANVSSNAHRCSSVEALIRSTMTVSMLQGGPRDESHDHQLSQLIPFPIDSNKGELTHFFNPFPDSGRTCRKGGALLAKANARTVDSREKYFGRGELRTDRFCSVNAVTCGVASPLNSLSVKVIDQVPSCLLCHLRICPQSDRIINPCTPEGLQSIDIKEAVKNWENVS